MPMVPFASQTQGPNTNVPPDPTYLAMAAAEFIQAAREAQPKAKAPDGSRTLTD